MTPPTLALIRATLTRHQDGTRPPAAVTTPTGATWTLGDAGGWSAGPGSGVLTWQELALEILGEAGLEVAS